MVPGPLILGAAFDGSCSLWERRCGSRGSCLVYDNQRLALYTFLFCLSVKIFGSIVYLLGWKLYKPPPIEIMDKKVGNGKINNAYESTHF